MMSPEDELPIKMTDIYDHEPWTDTDVDDLKAEIERGRSIEEVAQFLCRADSVDDVARECAERGGTARGRQMTDDQIVVHAAARRVYENYCGKSE